VKIRKTAAFALTLEEVLDAYPLDGESVCEYLNTLPLRFSKGDLCPGYGVEVRKLRISLPRYNISSRKGLRLLVLKPKQGEILIPVAIYKKGRFKKESDAVALVKRKLREILQEISGQAELENGDA
jgi:hypothetical protein